MKTDFSTNELSACPLCGGTKFVLLNTNDRYLMGLRTVGCAGCGLVQTNPRPTPSQLNTFYETEYRNFYQGVSTPDDEYVQRFRKNERHARTVEFLQSRDAVNAGASVLDVGCSEGAFFEALRAGGMNGDLCGVEPNMTFSARATALTGADVVPVLAQLAGRRFDLVTMIHVLEHHHDPLETLRALRECLNDGGTLYVDVPDADSYTGIDDLHIAHLHHFTTRTLTDLAVRAGFQIDLLERHTPSNHPKSIRLLATPAAVAGTPAALASRSSEASTWKRVAAISALGRRLRLAAGRIPLVRALYRRFRAALHAR